MRPTLKHRHYSTYLILKKRPLCTIPHSIDPSRPPKALEKNMKDTPPTVVLYFEARVGRLGPKTEKATP